MSHSITCNCGVCCEYGRRAAYEEMRIMSGGVPVAVPVADELALASAYERGRAAGARALARAMEKWARDSRRGASTGTTQALQIFVSVLPGAFEAAWSGMFGEPFR